MQARKLRTDRPSNGKATEKGTKADDTGNAQARARVVSCITMTTETSTCCHCGAEKPQRVETCPSCQKRTVKPSSYQHPKLPERDDYAGEEVVLTALLIIGGIGLGLYLVYKYLGL